MSELVTRLGLVLLGLGLGVCCWYVHTTRRDRRSAVCVACRRLAREIDENVRLLQYWRDAAGHIDERIGDQPRTPGRGARYSAPGPLVWHGVCWEQYRSWLLAALPPAQSWPLLAFYGQLESIAALHTQLAQWEALACQSTGEAGVTTQRTDPELLWAEWARLERR
jgi:hypothetical protein